LVGGLHFTWYNKAFETARSLKRHKNPWAQHNVKGTADRAITLMLANTVLDQPFGAY